MGNAGGLECGVEGTGVEGAARRRCRRMRGRHGLLRLERRTRSQNAGSRSAERHGPGLHHALPRIVACGPWRGLGAGVVGSRHAAVAATSATAPILAVVGTIVAAVV